ncbi:MAG: HSP20 family small heat-shock protein [Actinomycetota bacterium]|nr:HSP20 family small heat-shock protein [Actinomycetota bacterium]
MLIRTDPFRDLDRIAQQMTGTLARPSMMPMDAWQDGEEFVVELDLPGVDPDHIDLDVERNVVTVRAERADRSEASDLVISERPRGVFSRQLVLGDSLDTARIRAGYDAGVLVLRIPISERAKPRKIEVASGGEFPKSISSSGREDAHDATSEEKADEKATA